MTHATIAVPLSSDGTTNPSNMVHITECDEPLVALCGAKLRGLDTDRGVDCHVCLELHEADGGEPL